MCQGGGEEKEKEKERERMPHYSVLRVYCMDGVGVVRWYGTCTLQGSSGINYDMVICANLFSH